MGKGKSYKCKASHANGGHSLLTRIKYHQELYFLQHLELAGGGGVLLVPRRPPSPCGPQKRNPYIGVYTAEQGSEYTHTPYNVLRKCGTNRPLITCYHRKDPNSLLIRVRQHVDVAARTLSDEWSIHTPADWRLPTKNRVHET